MESLALTVEEVMDVRRVLVKAEMEKFLQNKELFNSLKKGKVRRPGPAACPLCGSPAAGGAGPGEVRTRLASSKAFLTDLLLLPDQVPAVLLAADLSLLQEVSLLQTAWLSIKGRTR